MSLFAILSMPFFTLLILSADRMPAAAGKRNSLRESPALEFAKGFFYAVPCLIVTLVLRRYVFLSYRGFRLFSLFLATDHLVPVVFLGVLYFLAYSRKNYRELLAFGGGFYTLLAIVEIFSHFGQYEPYHLFVLPAVRMAGLLFLTVFFIRFQEWYGLVRALFLVLFVAVPFFGGAITFLYLRAYLSLGCSDRGAVFPRISDLYLPGTEDLASRNQTVSQDAQQRSRYRCRSPACSCAEKVSGPGRADARWQGTRSGKLNHCPTAHRRDPLPGPGG